jgi:hypothetical protein
VRRHDDDDGWWCGWLFLSDVGKRGNESAAWSPDQHASIPAPSGSDENTRTREEKKADCPNQTKKEEGERRKVDAQDYKQKQKRRKEDG